MVVLHRGAGKTYMCCAELIKRAIECKHQGGALFLYMAPFRKQGKDIAWAALKALLRFNKDSISIREDELTITFEHNGAVIRIDGADNPDSKRGIHPHMVILDEVGQMEPTIWTEVVFPAIQRNNGTVIFIGTPKGDNLFKELYDLGNTLISSGTDERWYTCYENVYTAGVYDAKWIEENKPIMPEEKWNQEYMLDWYAVFAGSYYADILSDKTKGIIDYVPYNPLYPVITGWDLGIRDLSCIWFGQRINEVTYFIDYYEASDKDIFDLVNVVLAKPYRYDYHIVPHDAKNRSFINKKESRISVLKNALGYNKVIALDKPSNNNAVNEGISLVQTNLHTCKFDSRKCKNGLEHLMAYQANIDRTTGEFTSKPNHKHSDAADAIRTFFMGLRKHSKYGGMYDWYQEKNNGIECHDVLEGY